MQLLNKIHIVHFLSGRPFELGPLPGHKYKMPYSRPSGSPITIDELFKKDLNTNVYLVIIYEKSSVVL